MTVQFPKGSDSGYPTIVMTSYVVHDGQYMCLYNKNYITWRGQIESCFSAWIHSEFMLRMRIVNWFKKEVRNLWANLTVVTISFGNSELMN